ncbi:MAG: exopolysaccharide biosynthesis polyprenyl glycosylphosphotransferase, partial [Solirubrobacteraceae bacterium]
WNALRVVCDLLMLTAACCLARAIVGGPAPGTWLVAAFPPIALLALQSGGRYRGRMGGAILQRALPGCAAISTSAVAVLALALIGGGQEAAIAPLVVWSWLCSIVLVSAAAIALHALQRDLRRRGLIVRPALIVGGDATGVELAARIGRLPVYGLRAIGFLDRDPHRRMPAGAPPLLGGLADLAAVVARHDVRDVIICLPDADDAVTLELIARCDAIGLETMIVPRASAAVNSQTRFAYIGAQPLLSLRAVDREGWRFDVKHAVDRLLAALLLVALSPLLLGLALLVRRSSPGPILFRQLRTGRDGRVFWLLKFRTMLVADDRALPAAARVRGIAPGGVEGSDRRTRVGRLLRRTSLDELPQLINVIRGEMSLVGPRPERPEFAELFRHEVERYRDRDRVRAGITGWAQV